MSCGVRCLSSLSPTSPPIEKEGASCWLISRFLHASSMLLPLASSASASHGAFADDLLGTVSFAPHLRISWPAVGRWTLIDA